LGYGLKFERDARLYVHTKTAAAFDTFLLLQSYRIFYWNNIAFCTTNNLKM